MKIKSGVVSGASRLAKIQDLSKEAARRLKWFGYYNSHGGNARLTYRRFGISSEIFYRWKGRYNPKYLKSLEDHSHRPKQVRHPIWG